MSLFPSLLLRCFFAASLLFFPLFSGRMASYYKELMEMMKKSGSEPAAERPAEPDFPIRHTGAPDTP
jgi:hypothetical protein